MSEAESLFYFSEQQRLGHMTAWCVSGVCSFGDPLPKRLAGALMVYRELASGEVLAEPLPQEGATWADVWAACEVLYRNAHDPDHAFIEKITPRMTPVGKSGRTVKCLDVFFGS